ncbi:MAG: 16S rRNA (guanine(527)-N(7))-methyltransferase RsmG [Myxococcota bacterium]
MSDDVARWIAEGAEALEVPLEPRAADRLSRLVALLLRWNRRMNLVGRCDARQAVDRHVHDGLGLLRLLDRPEVQTLAPSWWDVGAGAGLPGLVLATARPALRLTLLEPIGKRVAFMREAVATLGLDGVEVREGRLEDMDDLRPRAMTSRATFPPEEWLARGLERVAPGGLVLVMMGQGAPDAVVRDAWLVDRFRLPLSGALRINAVHRAPGSPEK